VKTARGSGYWPVCDGSDGPGRGAHGRGHRHTVGAHERKKGGCHGYEAGKQVAGRKRPMVVDTQGLLLAVQGPPASL
jgi:hypothetical protein